MKTAEEERFWLCLGEQTRYYISAAQNHYCAHRGKLLGGCSAINAMTWMVGSQEINIDILGITKFTIAG